MRRYRRSPVSILVALILIGQLATPTLAQPAAPRPDAPEAAAALTGGQVRITQVASGLSSPVGVTNAGDGTNRLFVVEQRGTVRVISGNSLQPGFFLDIRGVAGGFTNGGERGLLSIVFHPAFETNRKLFVYYTDGDGDLVIAEMTANAARTSASVSTVDPILDPIEHTARANHNGGQLQFGPDNNLYIFTGDGGGGGDPDENSQDINSLLGKVLRVTPNLSGGRTFPNDNPYVGVAGNDAIWDIGMRNPWRASFDRANGTLWIADVGQGSWEEVNREPATSEGGLNYGWDCREGLHAYSDPSPGISCSGLTFTSPVAEYGHGNGDCSVTGGYVYRGGVFDDMAGQYVLGDYCSGRLWTLQAGAGSPSLQFHRDTAALITSFGEAENGELYMTDHGGRLYRVVAPPYNDVTDNSLIDHIMWITGEGISTGCSTSPPLYCPNASVTRAQMAAFLSRALDLDPTGTDFFTDDNGHSLEVSINRVAAAGITTGCAPNRYCPERAVTRGEMATFLDRALGLPDATDDYFSDDTGTTHEDSINAVREAGITFGCTATRFCPNASTTRAQMAAFLHRALGD